MLPLGRLLISSLCGMVCDEEIHAELDAQLTYFVDGMGRQPDFIDGHQHVHFLPVVRNWLETRHRKFDGTGSLPWLRGAPSMVFQGNSLLKAKLALVRLLARGFDQQMKAVRYEVRGPLAGFYDWQRPDRVSEVFQQIEGSLPEGAILMCHPGWIDETLIARDRMVEARPLEFEALMQRV